jgi:K(+)-stimulated pyrophosphate-energized sodium pump
MDFVDETGRRPPPDWSASRPGRRLFDGWAAGAFEARAHGFGDDVGQGGFAQAGRAAEQQWSMASPRCLAACTAISRRSLTLAWPTNSEKSDGRSVISNAASGLANTSERVLCQKRVGSGYGHSLLSPDIFMRNTKKLLFWSILLAVASTAGACAGEADIHIPALDAVKFDGLGGVSGNMLMYFGIVMCAIGAAFGLVQYKQTKALPVHASMGNVSNTIWETCKTYLFTQGKFLAILWMLIACCMIYYFKVLQGNSGENVVIILLASILGIMGSYSVAWFGIRINTVSNSRTAFSALKGNPLATLGIPLRSGMSVGLLLVAVELFFMICILMFLPRRELVGPCFIGFAIGESLGASVLRICGGIFTKIADIGSDLMKIIFKLPEDDPKNPGVIADCTGDNAGDSVGPTADGFETYGVTGVALIAFLALALAASPTICATLIVWLFTMRALMIVTSLISYFTNEVISKAKFGGLKDFDFEAPLTHLVWITSAVSIIITFIASKLLLGDFKDATGATQPNLWWVLSVIISCGTVAGALIPEFTKIFVSTKSRHVKEVTNCSRHGGASLNILSGFVAGNFSAFWMGLVIMLLMFTSYYFSQNPALLSLMPQEFSSPRRSLRSASWRSASSAWAP